jgi:L-ascorbate metabolism protein UlaG (beta-lactamase superfamily)
MEVTYIGHSGFLIEWESSYFLFDYFKGEIPKLKSDKKVFVFVSHEHHDHFNPVIFDLGAKDQKVEFILASEIKMTKKECDITSVSPENTYELIDFNQNKISIKTLKSTDSGVAFLLQYLGKTIYYAGDLNWWLWSGESKQYNNNMTLMFNKEMEKLKELPIDIAFAPLDPRQEEYYYIGLEKLINTTFVNYVFPMHFWEQPSIIHRFKQERKLHLNHTKVMDVSQEGQKWNLEI